MSDEQSRPVLRLGDYIAHEYLISSAPDFASEAAQRIGAELAPYAASANTISERVLTAHIAELIMLFAEVLRTRRMPPRSVLDPVASSAADRAREGIALGDLLDAYNLGFRVPFERTAGRLDKVDGQHLQEILALASEFNALVTNVVVEGYLPAQAAPSANAREAEQALLHALLDGGQAADVAAASGLRLADRYAVVQIVIGTEPAGATESPEALHFAQRRLGRALPVHLPASSAQLTADGATVLLASESTDDVALTRLRGVVDHLGAPDAPLLAAVVFASPADVPTAAQLAFDVLAVAQRSGRLTGLVTLDDVLIEFQLSRPSPAIEPLARLLDPLIEHPDKLETLRAFVAEGMNRRSVARRLHVHPNTVDYRLRTAAALIGLDPADPADAQRILASFAARDLLAAAG